MPALRHPSLTNWAGNRPNAAPPDGPQWKNAPAFAHCPMPLKVFVGLVSCRQSLVRRGPPALQSKLDVFLGFTQYARPLLHKTFQSLRWPQTYAVVPS